MIRCFVARFERFADQEVHARLDHRRESLLWNLQRRDRQRQLLGECLDRRWQSAGGQKPGVNPGGKLGQVPEGGARLTHSRLEDLGGGRRLGVDEFRGELESQHEADE
jgi:hypothetical protein